MIHMVLYLGVGIILGMAMGIVLSMRLYGVVIARVLKELQSSLLESDEVKQSVAFLVQSVIEELKRTKSGSLNVLTI